MKLFQTIESRRSIFPRQYNDKPIKKEDLKLILKAANFAPTHKKTEPWRFKVLQNIHKNDFGKFLSEKYKNTTTKFSEFKFESISNNIKRSSAVILICMQRDPLHSIPEWEEIASVSMAVQNMWLVSTELNIGSYWSSSKLIDYVHEFIKLKRGERCLGIFYMGYYDKKVTKRIPGSYEDKVCWFK